MDWKDNNLPEYFADEFAIFTVENFAAIPDNSQRIMRDIFIRRGVYVCKGRGVLIAEALLEVIKKEIL